MIERLTTEELHRAYFAQEADRIIHDAHMRGFEIETEFVQRRVRSLRNALFPVGKGGEA